MSLEQISFAAQIVSAIAIIASLIFVGMQVRQATEAVRNSSSQAHSAIYTQIVSTIIENADFAAIWRRGLTDPSAVDDDEWVRFVAYTSALFRFYESSRVQWLHGQLNEEHWQTIEGQIKTLGTQPGIQAWWKIRGHWHSSAFVTWFEGLDLSKQISLYGEGAERNSSTAGVPRASGAGLSRS
jgi:hypothetical protein